MQTEEEAAQQASLQAAESAHHRKTSPRSDLYQSVGWVVFGAATLIGSWRMDRLEKQDINPYTVPGLLPGLLGVAIMFFGVLMLYRSWQRNARAVHTARPKTDIDRIETRRMWTVLALCIGFAGGLVGRGLPFWLAAAVFITVAISILQFAERSAKNQRVRGIVVALITGVLAGIIIMLVFQEFFLVRLP